MISLNELFYWTNDFTELTILVNKQFFWKNGILSIEGKLRMILKVNEFQFVWKTEKNRSLTNDEHNWKKAERANIFISLNNLNRNLYICED